jgi:hypothetical protein
VKIVKQPKEYLYFIQDDIKAIEEDILTISPEKLNHLFNKISTYAQNDLFEIHILNAFLAVIQEKKEYYYQKQDQSYDYTSLKSVIIFIITLGLLFYAFYVLESDNSLKRDQIETLTKELEPYGVIVKEHSKRYYKATTYWLQFIPTKNLTDYQWIHAKKIIDHIYELHATIHGKIFWIFFIIFCGAWYSVKKLFFNIRQWLKPQYKKRYEKYATLENTIKHKIAELPSQYKVT